MVDPLQTAKDSLISCLHHVTKDQALEEIVPILFHPVVQGCFQLVGVRIQSPVMMSSKVNSQK